MKWKNDYLNIIVPCLFVILGIWAHYHMKGRNQYIEEHGVWTIYEIGRVRYTGKGGKSAPMYYQYRGKKYKDGVFVGDRLNTGQKGLRFFMMLTPEKPTKLFYTFDSIPAWFTLDAPDEGWKEKPTEEELREMMIQDGIKRGSK